VGYVSLETYTRVWRQARTAAFTLAQQRSPLGRRPYDLRHAAVSLWLNAGVPATQVAEWAGHSVAVLLKIYAKCIDAQDKAAQRRIEAALSAPDDDEEDTENQRSRSITPTRIRHSERAPTGHHATGWDRQSINEDRDWPVFPLASRRFS
jgi:hypothetical protein